VLRVASKIDVFTYSDREGTNISKDTGSLGFSEASKWAFVNWYMGLEI